jgi:hypothetical protein
MVRAQRRITERRGRGVTDLSSRPIAEPIEPETVASIGGLPVGVILLAGLRGLDAVLLVLAVAGFRDLPLADTTPPIVGSLTVLGLFALAVAVLDAVAATGLLLGHRWGWLLTMLICGAGLLLWLGLYATGRHDELRIGLLVVTALYLNQGAIKLRYRVEA